MKELLDAAHSDANAMRERIRGAGYSDRLECAAILVCGVLNNAVKARDELETLMDVARSFLELLEKNFESSELELAHGAGEALRCARAVLHETDPVAA